MSNSTLTDTAEKIDISFNPTNGAKTIAEMAKKADKLAIKWSESKTTVSGLKAYIAENKEFFGDAHTVLGCMSVGITVLNAAEVFGPSEHKQIMTELKNISNQIDKLSNTMSAEFANMSAHVNFNTALGSINPSINTIRSASRLKKDYLTALEIGNYSEAELKIKRTALTKETPNLHTSIETLYDSFISAYKATNILKSMDEYFFQSPTRLATKGYEIIHAVQEAVRIIGLKKRIELESDAAKTGYFSITECIDQVDRYLKSEALNYTDIINKMNEILESHIINALNNVDSNIRKYYEASVNKVLERASKNNPQTICRMLEENYSMVCFMATEYSNCSEDKNHLESLDPTRSLAYWHHPMLSSNLLINWQWVPDADNNTVQGNKNDLWSKFMDPLSSMPASVKKTGSNAGHYYQYNSEDIKDIICEKTSFKSLKNILPKSNVLVVRKSAAGEMYWAHSSQNKLAMVILDPNRSFYILLMLLDV